MTDNIIPQSPATMTDEEYEAWSEALFSEPPDDEEDWRLADGDDSDVTLEEFERHGAPDMHLFDFHPDY